MDELTHLSQEISFEKFGHDPHISLSCERRLCAAVHGSSLRYVRAGLSDLIGDQFEMG